MPEPPVTGVDQGVLLVKIAGKLVRPREQDLPVQVFDAPAARDEPGGQPVEELGMAWGFAANSEVRRRRHYAPAEMVLPDAIDDHPSGEGMVVPRDPLRKLSPAA